MPKGKKKKGQFHSWIIVDDTIAIKKIDKSIFEYNDTGIPEGTKWFWGADDLGQNEKLVIELVFRGTKYQSYMQLDKRNSAKLNWFADLGKELKIICNYSKSLQINNSLAFIKVEEDVYTLKVLDGDVVEASTKKLSSMEKKLEGRRVLISSVRVERSDENRRACIEYHGSVCTVCGFNFEEVYGELGRGFIEVHHIVPLSKTLEECPVDPVNDLTPLCSNCHRMIHRHKEHVLMISELKEILAFARSIV